MSTTSAVLLLLAMAGSAHAAEVNNTCMKAIVYKEAGNQPTKGVAAVVQTIRHRAKKKHESVCHVVKEEGQFSSYKKGMNFKDVKIPKNFEQKYEEAVIMQPVVPDCTEWYHTTAIKPYWTRERKPVARIKEHRFYC